MTRQAWIGLSLALLLVMPVVARAQSTDEDAIRELDEKWVAMVAADDVGGIVDLFADDGRFMPPNAPAAVGDEAIRQVFTSIVEWPLVTFAPDVIWISESGDMAIDVGTYHVELTGPEGTAMSDDGKYLTAWVKRDGEWKVQADIFNSDMPLDM